MSWLSLLRSAVRLRRGMRPQPDDLEQIVAYLRRRRERGIRQAPPLAARLLAAPGVGGGGDRLRALQSLKLRQTVEYAYRYVAYYRETWDALGLVPSDIRSLDDLPTLPLTRPEDYLSRPEAFISSRPGLQVTSSTAVPGTDARPVQVLFTREEVRNYAANWAIREMLHDRLGAGEIIQTHLPQELVGLSLVLTLAAHLAGSLILTYGAIGSLDSHLSSLLAERRLGGQPRRVTRLALLPGHLGALTRRAEQRGYHVSGLKALTVVGAPPGDDLQEYARRIWGLPPACLYTLNEALPAHAFSCPASDRLHWTDTLGYAEAVDAETGRAVPPGQPGMLTITTFYPDRELMPVIRYCTGDRVVLVPDPVCTCGERTTQLLRGDDRADLRNLVAGVALYRQAVLPFLQAHPELVTPPRFSWRMERREAVAGLVLDVELARSLAPEETNRLQEQIATEIAVGRDWQMRLGTSYLAVKLVQPDELRPGDRAST